METVVLTIHLLLALGLIVVVLLQRSEGGGLGMGGGGGLMTGRAAATALSKVTWIFGAAFVVTSLALTVIAARDVGGGSVLDRLGVPAPAEESGDGDAGPLGSDLLPSTVAPTATDAPTAPPAADAPSAPPPAAPATTDAAPVPDATPATPPATDPAPATPPANP